MKTVALTAVVLVVLLGGGAPRSQEISTDIFPSEDEIYDALRSGEITYQQYLILREIAIDGIDSTSHHLLDEIPNLNFFNVDSLALKTSLENEQETPFEDRRGPTPTRRMVTGQFRQRYRRYAEDEDRSKSSTSVQMNINNTITADIEIRREYTGDDRFVSRSIQYRSSRGPVREVVLGNFSRRFGLGTVFGYRGKLFGLARDLSGESFLYPDYGGLNGGLARLSFRGYEVQTLGSVVRSEFTRLFSWGAMVQATSFPFKPSVVLGITRLKNRRTGEYVADNKLALNGRHDYGCGYSAVEVCWQGGERSTFGAVVAEGRHRFRQAEIRYAGWSYSDGYIDLSGGSKAAAIYHDQTFETVDREYTSKRFGQQGLLAKTVVDLSDKIELANSLLYASFNADTANTQWLAQVSRKFDCVSVGIDFLSRGQTRSDFSSARRQTRLITRWRLGNFYLRTYIGYNSHRVKRDFTSFFVDLKYNFDSYGKMELWSNVSEIDHNVGRIKRWYAFVRSSIEVMGGVSVALKLSHTYSAGSEQEHRTIVGFDLSCCW
ncbi:MAG: hypothetical protein JSV52_10475 [Candidatus Zixiibacteriota bacterium]|nr:MAG: hypothetical protein JSV52_10475 [candidate division Zixibacteria bacterium]